MIGRRAAAMLAAVAAIAAGAGGAATDAPGVAARATTPVRWKPDVEAAVRFASGRRGRIAFSVRTPARSWHFHADARFDSASVLKAMLLVAYLNRPVVRWTPLDAGQRHLLEPMIRRSANAPASRLVQIVGAAGLRRLARRAGMRDFVPVTGIWGRSRITARDQSRFLLRIDGLLPPRHSAYAMRLLETVVSSQRWGIGQVKPRGWRLYFKGGWGSGTGRVDHQVALLTRGEQRVSVAILTADQGTHAYGKATLRAIAARLLHGLGGKDIATP